MKIFVAGATGVLGRGLLRQFRNRGHEVVGLARSEKGERIVRSLGGESRRADLFDVDSLARAAEGSEVVIHAVTAIPVNTKPVPADWRMNDRVRREGTRALCVAAKRIGARIFLLQSIVWVARPPDDSPFDETSPAYPDPITHSAFDAECIAHDAGGKAGIRIAVLRCGYFYGPDAAHTQMMGEEITRRRLPVIGTEGAVWANLHTDDAASAFVTAAEAGREGLWHVVDDQPATVKEVLTEFSVQLGAPPPRRIPAWLARLIVGPHAVDFFTRSTRTTNTRFRADFGWKPQYPSYREGIRQIVAAWKAEGFPERGKSSEAA